MRLVDCKMGQSLAPCDMDQQMRHLWARQHALLLQGHSLQLNCWHTSSAGRLCRFVDGSDVTALRVDVVLSSDVRLSSDMAASQTSGSQRSHVIDGWMAAVCRKARSYRKQTLPFTSLTRHKMMFPYVISSAALSGWKWVATAEYVENASAQSRGTFTGNLRLEAVEASSLPSRRLLSNASARTSGSRSPRSMYFPASMFFNI